MLWCFVPVLVCCLIAFLPNEGLRKKESKYIPASCPNPPNVVVIVSLLYPENQHPHTWKRENFNLFVTLLELLPIPSQGRSPILQLNGLFIRLLFTLILCLNKGVLIRQPRALGVVGKMEDCRRPNISADLICLSRSNTLSYYGFLVAMILVEKISISIYHHSVCS